MNEPAIKFHYYEPGTCFGEHFHEETQITLILSGRVEERVEGGHKSEIGPMDLVIKPSGLRHSNKFGRSRVLTLQLSADPLWLKSMAPKIGLTKYESEFKKTASFEFLRWFAHAIDQMEPSLGRFQNRTTKFLGILSGSRKRVALVPPAWLKTISLKVESEFSQHLSIIDLARQQQKHPVSVSRAYRAHFGVSIKERIQQLRVAKAAELLARDELTTITISQACGFSDQSHLNRIFKSHTGLTPGKFRRSLQSIG